MEQKFWETLLLLLQDSKRIEMNALAQNEALREILRLDSKKRAALTEHELGNMLKAARDRNLGTDEAKLEKDFSGGDDKEILKWLETFRSQFTRTLSKLRMDWDGLKDFCAQICAYRQTLAHATDYDAISPKSI